MVARMQPIPIRPGVYRFAPRFDIVGAISGLLALVISGAQTWQEVTHAPDTRATNESTAVYLSFDPVDRRLTVNFPVLLENAGTKEDQLKNVKSRINGRKTWNSDVHEITVREDGGAGRQTPFALYLGTSRLDLGMYALEENVLVPGTNRIDLTLETSRQLALDYCFYLTAEQLGEMQQSEQVWERKMVRMSCGGGGEKHT